MPARAYLWLPLLAICICGLATGCKLINPPDRPIPLPAGVNPQDLVDPDDPSSVMGPLELGKLAVAAEEIRNSRKPKVEPTRKYNVLVMSGGAVYGAYTAGVLVGWTAAGTRPDFDVVTGISTGALIAPLAFAGPEYDQILQNEYTTVSKKDIFTIRRTLRSLLAESVADNSPLRARVERLATPELLAKIVCEHRKGRRLYVGTTNLDTKQLVVWDLGAILCQGTPEARALFIDTLLASSAVPGFFPSVRFRTQIDGQQFEELHVDGGVARSMFFRPPYMPGGHPDASSLSGSNLYVIVAGKLYADPKPVRPFSVSVAGTSISSLVYAQTRGDLFRLFTYTVLTGMNYRVTAIPQELEATTTSTDFDPVEMTKLFDEGYRRVTAGEAWQGVPPGFSPGEETHPRSGPRLAIRTTDGGKSAPLPGPSRPNYNPLNPRLGPFPLPSMWQPILMPTGGIDLGPITTPNCPIGR